MYLFSRTRMHHGSSTAEFVSALTEAAAAASDACDIPIFVWQSSFHPMGNAFTSSARVESRAELEHAWDQIAASEDAVAAMDRVAELASGAPMDHLGQIMGGSLGERPAHYVMVTTGRAHPGLMREAVTWGVEMAEKAQSSIGATVAATLGVYGEYGSVSLITSYQTADEMDEMRGKFMADGALNDHVAAGADIIEPGVQFLLRRIR